MFITLYFFFFFFFNDTATTEIYTLSLHDALPICPASRRDRARRPPRAPRRLHSGRGCPRRSRSEEHTSELQSQSNLVCRLLLEKKKKIRARVDCIYTAILVSCQLLLESQNRTHEL